jgi:hypothetical protein
VAENPSTATLHSDNIRNKLAIEEEDKYIITEQLVQAITQLLCALCIVHQLRQQ